MKSCVDVLLELSVDKHGTTVYAMYLEPDLLKESEVFYKAEGERLMDTCDASEYLKRVSSITLFHPRTQTNLTRIYRLRRAFMVKNFEHITISPPAAMALYGVSWNHVF